MQGQVANAVSAVARYQQPLCLDNRSKGLSASLITDAQRRRSTALVKRQRTTHEGRRCRVHSEPQNNEIDSQTVNEIQEIEIQAIELEESILQEPRADDVSLL